MSGLVKNTRATIMPCLRYRNAQAAIEWLCQVFGFERHLVVPHPDGGVAHAELSLGNGMIMLGSVRDDELGRRLKQPDQLGGAETQSPYVVVADADMAFARAKAAGAEIVRELADAPQGGRAFACRDLEGRLWSLGTYDPWVSPRP